LQPQLLVFDLDGTLIDSRADLAAGINHMRATLALPPLSVETVSAYIGDGIRKLVERSLQDAGAAVDIEEALRVNRAYYYRHLNEETTTYPGVRSGIRALSGAGHTLALLTNKPGEASRAIMKAFGLESYFKAIIGGGDLSKLKPEPDGICEILRISDRSQAQAWMIGDHHTDLLAAQNAGVKSALVEYGFGDAGGLSAHARFGSFAELVDFFNQ
jgi:phosphoglycolate phosphatase